MSERTGGRAPTGMVLAVVVLAALAAGPGRPAAGADEEHARTDALALTAPARDWQRAGKFDAATVSFAWKDDKGATAQVRARCEALFAAPAGVALGRLLESEQRSIRAELDGRQGVERSSFEPDSMRAGTLTWLGFRVRVRVGELAGTSWRWVALHPGWPGRARAFVLSFDEYAPKDHIVASQLARVRAAAATLEPRGGTWRDALSRGWLDARTATFAARIDSAQKLCWSTRPGAPPSRSRLGIGPGLVPDGDFHETGELVPADSLVDPAAADYGTAFDRNGDGRYDLIVWNRGVQPVVDDRLLPQVALVADENFDGRADAVVIENVDLDGDGRADHRLWVADSNGDGTADRAVRFVDAFDGPDAKELKVAGGRVDVRVVGSSAPGLGFEALFEDATAALRELSEARHHCTP